MKFLTDMGISLRTFAWLRELGHDVFLRDRGLQALPDNEILDLAFTEQRIILTIDLDFAQLLAIGHRTLPSVILFRLGNENYNEINQRLTEILDTYQSELDSGAIISVNNKRAKLVAISAAHSRRSCGANALCLKLFDKTFRVKKLPI